MQHYYSIYYLLDGEKKCMTAVGIDERFDCLDYVKAISGDLQAIIDEGIDE